jgi:hypothetical protein
MSRIRADRLTNKEGTGAPLFPNGIRVVGLTSLSNVVAGVTTFTSDVSIGGTLTYEDVTNIDSVGMVTARTGIKVLAGGINAVGVVTGTSFSGGGDNLTFTSLSATSVGGYNQLSAPFGTTVTYTVKVIAKTAAHRYNGSGSSSGYTIDEVESPYLTLTPGRTYKFDQADSSNGSHPIKFYLNADKTGLYEGGVTYNGTAGSAGAYTQIVVNDYTPTVLHYQCVNHAYMGNAVNTSSNSSMSAQSSKVVAMGANSVDCRLGNYFTKTITGATTFTFDNVPASGVAFGFTMEVTLNGSNAITWPGTVKWNADTAPTLTDGKTQLFMFITDDGGTRWRGSALVDYVN